MMMQPLQHRDSLREKIVIQGMGIGGNVSSLLTLLMLILLLMIMLDGGRMEKMSVSRLLLLTVGSSFAGWLAVTMHPFATAAATQCK